MSQRLCVPSEASEGPKEGERQRGGHEVKGGDSRYQGGHDQDRRIS